MAKSRVIDRDRGLKIFLQRFKEANGSRVKVGVTASVGAVEKKTRGERVKEAVTLVMVAFWNEYGTKRKTKEGAKVEHVPARSFVRSTTDEQTKKIHRLKRQYIEQIMDGKLTVRTALGLLGEFLQAKIQTKIRRLKDPPNAASTIARKASSNPLVDLSQLLQSIRYEVHMRGGSGA
jgi:hypothetical protein